MKVLIYIEQLAEPSFTYTNEIINWAHDNIENLVTFDLDNFSDPYMFKYAMQLVENEEKISIVIDIKEKTEAGKMTGLIEKIIQHKEKCMVMMNGEQVMIEKMLSILKERYRHEADTPARKKIIAEFMNSN
ncbi:MAG: hypothetical protein ACJ75J_15550 [Cytophagaceae bacterium]